MIKYFKMFIVIVALFYASNVFSQSTLIGEVEEAYSGKVAVSGSVLVGAFWGFSDNRVDPTDIRLSFENKGNIEKLCLLTKTRDGVYWSQAKFSMPNEIEFPLNIAPTDGWKFRKELKGYNRKDFTGLARLGDDCLSNPELPISPLSYEGDSRNLVVMINSQRAVKLSANISNEGGVEVDGICEKHTNSAIRSTAFNFTCQFDLTDFSTNTEETLTINRRLRIGSRTNSYKLAL